MLRPVYHKIGGQSQARNYSMVYSDLYPTVPNLMKGLDEEDEKYREVIIVRFFYSGHSSAISPLKDRR